MKIDKILTFDKHNKCFATLVVISYQHERGHIYTRQGSCCWVGLKRHKVKQRELHNNIARTIAGWIILCPVQ